MAHVRPNKISYNSVINAWAKNKNKEYKSGTRAERLLYRLFEFYKEEGGCDEALCPDAMSFNSVINTGELLMKQNNFFQHKYGLNGKRFKSGKKQRKKLCRQGKVLIR